MQDAEGGIPGREQWRAAGWVLGLSAAVPPRQSGSTSGAVSDLLQISSFRAFFPMGLEVGSLDITSHITPTPQPTTATAVGSMPHVEPRGIKEMNRYGFFFSSLTSCSPEVSILTFHLLPGLASRVARPRLQLGTGLDLCPRKGRVSSSHSGSHLLANTKR